MRIYQRPVVLTTGLFSFINNEAEAMEIKDTLHKILNHEELGRDETRDILVGITRGDYPAEMISALLTAIQMRGIAVDELLGFRDGVLETGVGAVLDCDRYIDIVGTGGDGKNTFNISTCSCFVVAGAGYKVAKHGNCAATSTSGASDVMKAHGVEFTADTDRLKRSIEYSGVAYLHAPLFARAMKSVAPVRRVLCFPTCFNLLGPLVNPSRPHCQLLGVANLSQMRLYGSVYRRLGLDYGIVNSTDGYDEISLTGSFKVITNNGERIYKPSDIGMDVVSPGSLAGGATVEEAKEIFDSVLENRSQPQQRDVVLANAAFAIYVLERGAKGIDECLDVARVSLESGRALETLRRFVEINGR